MNRFFHRRRGLARGVTVGAVCAGAIALAAAGSLTDAAAATPSLSLASDVAPSAQHPGSAAGAPARVTQDRAAKTVTIADGEETMRLAYGTGVSVDSFTLNGTQLLNAGITSEAKIDATGDELSSTTPAAAPVVAVRGDRVTASFVMSDSAVSIDETWTFDAAPTGIALSSTRTYHWAETTDTQIVHNGDLEIGWARIWSNIRRPQDGGDIPLGNAYTGENGFFLNEPNERYGVEESQFVMLDNGTKQALDVDASSNRNLATEFAYTGDGNTYQETQVDSASTWDYVAGSKASGLVYGGHSSNGTDMFIYAPVTTAQDQRDTVTYQFKADDYEKYYSLGGTINGIADTAALSSLLNDFGRSGVIDKDYGMSTVGLLYPGVGPYDMVYADRTVEGYFDPAMTTSQENLLTYFKDDAQQSDGHMDGRTFHLDTPWGTNTLYDADPSYAMAIADMYQYSGDTSWVTSMRSSGERALAYMIDNQYAQSDGLFHNDLTSCTSTKSEREWNDGIYVKYESGYVNELMYQALTEWSSLERTTFHDTALANSYSSIAARLKTQFNLNDDAGGLWDPSTGMFAYWRCPDGTVQGKVEQTQVNLQAIFSGIVSLPRAQQILAGIDKNMQLEHLKLIPENFIPLAPTTEDYSGDHFGDGIEDGSVYPLMTEEYMRAAAIVGERNSSLTYLDNTLARYTQDGFNGWSFLNSLTLQPRPGEAWFPANANAAAGVYSDMLGIQPTADGLTIAPNIPASMYGTHVTEKIHSSDTVSITYHSELSQSVQYSSGDQPVTLQWSGQQPSRRYTVSDNGREHTVTADSMGMVRYTYVGPGQHTVTLVNGSAAGYVLPKVSPDLAYGKQVTATSSLEGPLPGDPAVSDWSKAFLVDGMPYSMDNSLGWMSNSDLDANHTESVTVDLGKSSAIGNVTLWPYDYDAKASSIGDYFPIDFTIAVSNDGEHWTTEVSETDYPQPTGTGGQSFSFAQPVKARYVRVEGTNLRDEGGYRMALAELQVFAPAAKASGSTAAPSPTRSPSGTPSPSDTPSPSSTPTSSGTPSPSSSPSGTPTPSDTPSPSLTSDSTTAPGSRSAR